MYGLDCFRAKFPEVVFHGVRALRNLIAENDGNARALELAGGVELDDARLEASKPVEAFFDQQRLDHFADPEAEPQLWKQRYQYNESFHAPGGAVFLLLGGEGPANPIWLAADTAPMAYAKEHGAAVFQLEHRFYGESQPFADLSDEHLAFLSSRQALEDAINFVQQVVLPRYGAGTKVISFGGSYPGALSAWLRLKYPETIHAAVSTSGPILAQQNFVAYQQVVQDSLETAADGKKCVKRIKQATAHYQGLTNSTEGLAKLAKQLNTCAPIGNYSDGETGNSPLPAVTSSHGVPPRSGLW